MEKQRRLLQRPPTSSPQNAPISSQELLQADAAATPPSLPDLQEYYDKLPEADDDENDMLDLAFQMDELAVVEMLLKKGWPVNQPDASGRTLLHRAANLKEVELALKYGADPSHTCHEGLLPEHHWMLAGINQASTATSFTTACPQRITPLAASKA